MITAFSELQKRGIQDVYRSLYYGKENPSNQLVYMASGGKIMSAFINFDSILVPSVLRQAVKVYNTYNWGKVYNAPMPQELELNERFHYEDCPSVMYAWAKETLQRDYPFCEVRVIDIEDIIGGEVIHMFAEDKEVLCATGTPWGTTLNMSNGTYAFRKEAKLKFAFIEKKF